MAPGGRGPAGWADGGGPFFSCGSPPPPTPWACAENAKTVSAAASGRTILDRREAFILENPSFAVQTRIDAKRRHGRVLLTDFVEPCLVTNP
jgi:hypothetical protein